MGIPMFYRWLTTACDWSIVDVKEEYGDSPVDTTKPNPNGFEFDNLYLDMNNIIHPCFHPEYADPPKTYDEVFKAIFKYIDRIFSLIRPRKLLYVAIDGVAPRAKMNQQRARRFKTAKDSADNEIQLDRSENGEVASGTKDLDSNFITPGTEFMEMLSSTLQYYICARMNHDPAWQGIKVILSDASVPGEGEHKIMSYIRLQRNLPGFDPNTRHCVHGLDADLILLSLATHEAHISILREIRVRRPTEKKNAKAHHFRPHFRPRIHLEDYVSRQTFKFINLWILRKELVKRLTPQTKSVKVDPERLIDDFVFMCVFVGNDFLPNVPSLDITEGAMGLLLHIYKRELIPMGGHLIDSFKINMKRLEHFLKAVGEKESGIFKKRLKNSVASNLGVECVRPNTNVNFEDYDWKESYYAEKFEVQTSEKSKEVKENIVLKFVEGISWVMHYYYSGVCSWQWFYPYHYAPLASDFRDLGQLKIHFTLGKPFKPFNQLMGVLPASSGQALPVLYRKLMVDPSSPILDFYPTDFDIELIPNRPHWQAICKLPFIDESRLLNEIAKVQHTLTDEEKRRNSLGVDKLFVHTEHPLAAKIFSFAARNKDNPKLNKAKLKRKINPKASGGMNGYIYISNNPICPSTVSSPLAGMDTLTKNEVLAVFYKYPTFHPHIPRLPEGVIQIPVESRSRKKGVAWRRITQRSNSGYVPSASRKPSLQNPSSNNQPSITEPPSTGSGPSVAELSSPNTDNGVENSNSKRKMPSIIRQMHEKRRKLNEEGAASLRPSVQDAMEA